MLPTQLSRQLLTTIARIGADPNDNDDLRLQKSLLVICASPFMLAGVAWGLMYIPLAGVIPLSYSVISLLSIVHFGLTYRYQFFVSASSC